MAASWQIPSQLVVLGRVLGSGAYGEVREAMYLSTPVAAKSLHPSIAAGFVLTNFQRELDILQTLRHPNILQLLGITDTKPHQILTELMESDLLTICEAHRLPLGVTADITRHILRGLEYIHSRTPPVLHRDISAKNCLAKGDQIKIADLGQARLFSDDAQAQTRLPGSPVYSAPEAFDMLPNLTPAMDIFSLGILLCQLITGDFPDLQLRTAQITAACQQQPKLRRFIQACVLAKPSDRPTATQALRLLEQDIPPDQHRTLLQWRQTEVRLASEQREQRLQMELAKSNQVIQECVQRQQRHQEQIAGLEERYQRDIAALQAQLQQLRQRPVQLEELTRPLLTGTAVLVKDVAGPGIVEQTIQQQPSSQQLWYLSKQGRFRFNGKWESLPIKCAGHVNNRICRMSYGGVDCVVWMEDTGNVFTQDIALQRPPHQLPSLLTGEFHTGTAMTIHNNVLYVIGCDKDSRGIYALQLSASQWQRGCIMNTQHKYSAVGVIGDKIYISDDNGAECYDIVTNECVKVSGKSAYGAGYCVYQNKLYVTGGTFAGRAFQCYDPVSDKWTRLADMPTARYGHSLVVYIDRLWAIGDGGRSTKVESYDVAQNKWRPESDLPSKCAYGGAIVL